MIIFHYGFWENYVTGIISKWCDIFIRRICSLPWYSNSASPKLGDSNFDADFCILLTDIESQWRHAQAPEAILHFTTVYNYRISDKYSVLYRIIYNIMSLCWMSLYFMIIATLSLHFYSLQQVFCLCISEVFMQLSPCASVAVWNKPSALCPHQGVGMDRNLSIFMPLNIQFFIGPLITSCRECSHQLFSIDTSL